jgi:hypothetical protein
VNLWHCQKTWSWVSSDVPHVQIPFGTILKRARLCGHFRGDRRKSPLFCSVCIWQTRGWGLYQGTTYSIAATWPVPPLGATAEIPLWIFFSIGFSCLRLE